MNLEYGGLQVWGTLCELRHLPFALANFPGGLYADTDSMVVVMVGSGLDIAEWRVNELGDTQMMWGGPSADLHIIASLEGFPLLGKVSENSWPIQI